VGLTAGIPVYVDLQEVLNEMDLTVGKMAATDKISAVQGLLRGMRIHGGNTVLAALQIAERTWGRTAQTWNGTLVCGLVELLGEHPDLDRDRLVERLRKGADINGWIGKAVTAAAGLSTSMSG